MLVYNLIEAGRQGTQLSLGATRKVGAALLYAHRGHASDDAEYIKYIESWSATGTHMLYSSISLIELFAQASFSILQVSSSGGFYSAIESVRTIDALFGSNESSRMLASVICFMRKELEAEGNYHGLLYGLTKALSTFALLQNLTFGRTAQERRDRICWDVTSSESGPLSPSATRCQVKPLGGENTMPAEILRQIPANASYTVSQETTIRTKTFVKVEEASQIVPGKSRFSFETVRRKLKTSKFIKQRQAAICGTSGITPAIRSYPSADNIVALQYRRGEPECVTARRAQLALPRREHVSAIQAPSRSVVPSRRPYCVAKNISTSSVVTIQANPWEVLQDERPRLHTWPPVVLERLLYRYLRFSTAAYGQIFLQLLGFSEPSHWSSHFVKDLNDHENHAAFASHVGCNSSDILLSSFAPGNAARASPSIVFFVTVDQQSQSIVVSLRGTLGFSDLLTDLTAEYHPYKRRFSQDDSNEHFVHKGVLEAAQRLANNKALLNCLKMALEQRPQYGLVLTGHSLGGSVAALLALEWSMPAQNLTADVKLAGYAHYLQLPGFPIVPVSSYGYGTPACLSPSLCSATAGLVVTCLNGFDVVPSLSFGIVRDFKSISQVLSQDETGVLQRIGKRLVAGVGLGLQGVGSAEDDDYLFAVLKTLRCQMDHDKLVPPGRILAMQISRQHLAAQQQASSSPAHGTRVVVSEVADVQARFGEMVFAKSMLSDHSPVAYEAALQALVRGMAERADRHDNDDDDDNDNDNEH